MHTIKIKSPKYIYIIFLFYCLKAIKSKASLSYPHSVNLNSGDILIIHKFGVTVYDFNLTNIKNQIVKFEDDELIETEEDLTKLTVESFNGYIFSIIKDKIYIFNEQNGALAYNSSKIINRPQDAEYYTLVSVNITNNSIYSYVIGYVDSNHLLNLFYYEYNSEDKKNELISSKIAFKHESNSFESLVYNRGLSCAYMKNIYNNCTGQNKYSYNNYCDHNLDFKFFLESLVCFYLINLENAPTLISSFYIINKGNILKYDRYKLEGPAIFGDNR